MKPFLTSIKAINWAVDRKVDIISMSFSMLDESDDLKNSLRKAYAERIVMFCSSHDEGARQLDSWPASAPETLTIVACDEYGSPLREVDKDKYEYMLHGQQVAAGTVPFLDSADRISGSSVATATAAGLGSLMLSCARASGQAEGKEKASIIRAYFKAMCPNPMTKYVLLEKFGGIDERVKEGESISAENILGRTFFRVDG